MDQLVHRKRPGQAIVRLGPKPTDAASVADPSREHKDSCGTTRLAEAGQNRPPIDQWQILVKDHEIVRLLQRGPEAKHTVALGAEAVAVSRKCPGNTSSEEELLFDHKDAHRKEPLEKRASS